MPSKAYASTPHTTPVEPSVSVLAWTDALNTCHNEWVDLVIERQLNPTMLPQWLEISRRTSGLESPVSVASFRCGSKLVGVLPYFKSPGKALGTTIPTLHLLTNLVSYHANIVTSAPTADILADFIRRTTGWEIFRIANIQKGSSAERAVQRAAQHTKCAYEAHETEESPYLPITANWTDYLSTRSKKFRYKLRQREKLLQEEPSLSLVSYRSPCDGLRLYSDILAIEAKSWKASYGLDITSRKRERDYYAELIPYLERERTLHADVLYFEGRPIAYSLCCNWYGWFGQLKTSFDTSFAELSPGSIVIDSSIKAAFGSQASEFDFLGDTDNHKLAWTSSTRQHRDYFLYRRAIRARTVYAVKRIKRHFSPSKRERTVKPR